MTRVIHTGDTHIGYRQYHSAERRADFLAAFRQVVLDAVDDDVDAVVHAGDLFHDRRPDLRDLLGTLDVLGTLEDADIPFLAIVGNHEGTRDAQWLDLFERLGLATRLDATGTAVGETTFYGLDYVSPSQRDRLDYDFDPAETPHAALVAHGLFEPFSYADWDTETVLGRASVDFDAILLGDNHTPDRARIDDTWVTYCGSTERTSAREREERGYNLVEFDGDVRIARRGLDVTRDFAFVDVELDDGEGIDRVIERVGQYDLTDAVVVVRIEGDGEAVTPAEVESYALDRGALVARVNDAREVEDDTDLSVSFANPDEAARQRVRELGLSAAADDIDETVRASKVADSNVRETVETRVRERLDDGTAAFEGVDGEPSDGSGDEPSLEADTTATKPSADTGNESTEPSGSAADATAQATSPTEPSADSDEQASMEEYL